MMGRDLFVKQKLSMWLGLTLVVVHIAMTFYLWFMFSGNDAIYVEKLATPISAAFCISIVKWFIGNQGILGNEDYVYVGLPYVILILIVSVALVGAHVGGAVVYQLDHTMTASDLNRFYLFVEAAMGGLFALVFSDLYEKPVP